MKVGLVPILLIAGFAATVNAAESSGQGILEKKISLHVKDQEVGKVLHKIERQALCNFTYQGNEIGADRRVTVSVTNSDLETVLKILFKGRAHYEVIGNEILLTPWKSLLKDGISSSTEGSDSVLSLAAQRVSGIITDENGIGMPGVSVVLKGTQQGTTTDVDGSFAIEVPGPEAVLVFSFVGYQSEEVVVENRTAMNLSMKRDDALLDEIVVVGYGTQKKVNVTGSVATVDGSDLRGVSTSTAQALQGRLPGVQITQNTGAPGATSTIKIRGVGSLKSNNAPLIVVDGFIADRIDDIAAGDIASVSVLKDAASSAIYGSRAANGVILITTKRGQAGRMVVDFGAEYGFQEVTKLPRYLNARDYAQKQNEYRAHSNLFPLWEGNLAPETLSGGTDWFDYLYGNSAPIQNYRLGISGGSETTKYAVSLNYIDQEGILKETSYDRLNMRSNFDHQFNKRVKLSTNLDIKTNSQRDASGGFQVLAISAVRSSPTIPVTFPDGTPGIYLPSKPGEISTDGTLSPNWLIGKQEDKSKALSVRATAALEVGLMKGLVFRSVLNAGLNYSASTVWKDKYSVFTPEQPTVSVGGNKINSLQNGEGNSKVWEVQELLTYKTSVGQHNISALAGFSAEKGASQSSSMLKEDFPNNSLRVMNAGNKLIRAAGNKTEASLTSLFSQLNYDYAGKYLFQANVRRDGSSVFAPGHQFGTFPSFSAAWRVSEENFMNGLAFLTDLKIRAGYGMLGNAGIPHHAWISSYSLTDGHAFGPHRQSYYPAYYLTRMPNETVKWETTTTSNLGIDLGLFQNRFVVVFDRYVKSTTDLLLDATVPFTAGYSTGPVVNIGEVENKGWELSASWNDQVADFEYGVSVNLSRNKNKVVDMGGIAALTGSGRTTREGLPIDAFWGYKTDGIFRTWDEIQNYPHLAGDLRPGDWKYRDISGPEHIPDGKIDASDMTYLGDMHPNLFYGINLILGWKGFDLSVLFNGEAGKYDFQETVYGMGPDKENILQFWFDNRAILNAEGNVTSGTTPAMGSKYVADQYSDGGNLYNTSYLRVKNAQLGYTLPAEWLSRIGINSARIYANAVNPFLFTDYIGFDPETTYRINYNTTGSRGGSLYYPVSKSYTLGVSIKF